MASLAGDQPRPPPGPPPDRADLLLLCSRRQPRARPWPARAVTQAGERASLRLARLPPTPPPSARRRRRHTPTPSRLPTRAPSLDIHDQRSPPRQSEPRVTVKPHPGSSFSCEPWQTHSLEGGPDGLPSRPQPNEARHLGPVRADLVGHRLAIEVVAVGDDLAVANL